ncbi:MAG: tRNA pseudouridine(55) synthase TruB [Treponema sp.]|nr:tRNA pseudouridine(55) synthase TruB [Treponema sp.]
MYSGLILLNKPSGITSFDALREIKKALGTGKVGHTGTLDKFARGLLIVLTGRALKLCDLFTRLDKKYTGKIHFGKETDTLDPEGEIIAEASLPSREEAEKVFPRFTGSIIQSPPSYSAIHINGKRASDLARSGKTPEMKKREITIYRLELLSWQPPFAEITVHCSSGTYIRSLARDIAIAAGSRGYLCELTRTQVGGFSIESDSIFAESLTSGEVSVFPIDKNVISKLGLPWIDVTENEARDIYHGKPLDNFLSSSASSRLLSENSYLDQHLAVFYREELIAILENVNRKWKYGRVIANAG